MAEFRARDDSSDSDDDDEVLFEIIQAIFHELEDRPPAAERDDDENMAAYQIAVDADEDPAVALRLAILHDINVPAARRAAEEQAAGGDADVGAGAGRPLEPATGRRLLQHVLSRRRVRHLGHARAVELREELARLRRCRVVACEQQQIRDQYPSLTEHTCQYCPVKNRKLEAAPHLKFRPTTLRQQILLQLGYTTYGKTEAQSAENLPLPDALTAEVTRVHQELDAWRQDTKCFDETLRDSFIYRCFLSNLHWIPGKTVIDRRATAQMILQCDVGFHRMNEFMLAAANCLEDEVRRLWPLLDQRTRDVWASADNPYAKNPVLMYWISKCANQPGQTNRALNQMTSYCIERGDQMFDTLIYFWPLILESKGGINTEETAQLLDHAFHEAIERSNRDVVYFVWRQAPVENHRSMISAARCCGARNAYYAFGKAVGAGQFDVVQFIWNKTDAEQHNGMLLAEHGKSFCLAAESGFVDIARLLWRDTTSNQRFVLLFEQSCAAFRRSCVNGHAEIVRLLWENTSVEQRRQVLTMCHYEAIAVACRNGHLKVVQYLWENLGDNLKARLVDCRMDSAILSKCISAAALPDGADTPLDRITNAEPILRYLFLTSDSCQENSHLAPTKTQLFGALMFDDAVALKALVERVKITKKWEELNGLLDIFDHEQQDEIRVKMPVDLSPFFESVDSASDGACISTACIPKSSVAGT